ncbi:NAD(P)-dependent alcohol dehydrogenase [Halomarina litorea]|uniref:NAD(P)-dependent alcohol dehydrogenase n=1 Tax=Halomarina litorea TaxID=2961595 RepID=UPI0020C2960E|nr:NAD(P)-dependent alcohol dehydrogenase [Halomarina sp. BCD28]
MQVAVLTEPGTLELEERERPDPAPGEVLVRVGEVGICGSDLHYYDHGRIGDYVVESPLILGHEAAGEVVGAGDGVTALQSGDRVAIEPGVPCRECEWCKRGEYHLCPDVRFMATPPHDGALAEYVAWPADLCHPLPRNVSTRAGALCEPLSVGIHVCRRGDVGVGDTVLITGAGPIGLLTMDAARAAGATEVLVADVVPAKLDRARERGADAVVDATGDLAGAVDDYTSGRGVDVVVEASGARPAIEAAPACARRGGVVVQVGLAAQAEAEYDVLSLVDDELDVRGSFRYSNTYPAAVSLLADGRVDVAGIVDFTAPLADVGEAFERARDPAVVKGCLTL